MNVRYLVSSASRRFLAMGSLMLAAALQQPVHASGVDLSKFRRIEPQYIAALGEPGATSGSGAQSWGLWSQDPGPRGCKLDRYPELKAADRTVTTVLTIQPKDKDGNQRWELADGATLYDVTHLACRSARYTPATANNSCSPANVRTTGFPVNPGAAMPAVNGCRKQDYTVLIVIGLPATP
jgi:hypothetical protein